MTPTEFLANVSQAIRGLDDDPPTLGTDEAVYWLSVLNRKKNELYNNARVLWDATFSVSKPTETGTVATVGTTALTGTSTRFTDYKAGDTILVSGETVRTIDTITSDTVLTVTVAFANTDSALTFTHNSIIATGVENYSLHRNFIAPAERAYIQTTDQKTYFDFIQARELNPHQRQVYISSMNPKQINFTTEIESTEEIVGGTLVVPGYFMPADITSSTDVLPLPDPYWGVMATASEIAFNDLVYEEKAAELNQKANSLYLQMLRNNRRNPYGNPKQPPHSHYRIRGTEIN